MRRILLFASALAATPLGTQGSTRWLATWSPSYFAAPAPPPRDSVDRTPTYVDRTIRQVLRSTLGGDRVRIRLTNENGERALVVGAAHVAVRDSGAAIRAATRHAAAFQTSYVSAHGDFAAAAAFAPDTAIRQWLWLAGVDVENATATGVIVAIGNSITDGTGSTPDSNSRWPDVLARRLVSAKEPPKSVVNAGIGGNRVLSPTTGPSALARFDRDVLYDSGDHLHPSDAGYKAMGESIDLTLFRRRPR